MEFLVEKIGMSRTVGSPSIPVTLLKVISTKICASGENGVALVAYPKGKAHNKSIAGQQKKYNLSKEFNRFVTLRADIATSALKEENSSKQSNEPAQQAESIKSSDSTKSAQNAMKAVDLDMSILESAKRVKATFYTKGRGFSGVMKRWNFQGGPAAHGSRFHRRVGSIGNREWPGRVQKGKKMAGHYGNEKITVQAEVVSFDKDNNVLVLKGSVAGYNGAQGRISVLKGGK